MLVIATRAGFDGVYVPAGTEFDLDLSKLPKGKDGKPIKPSWVEPATEANRAQYSAVPQSHPKLDNEGRPYPYSVPATPPGVPGAPMDVIAKVVNDANEQAVVEAGAEAVKVEAAQEAAKVKTAEPPEARTLEDWDKVANGEAG